MDNEKLIDKKEILEAIEAAELKLEDLEVMELERKIAPAIFHPLYGVA